ncbi:MAG TPA: MBL fold metallo-hydrolase [bacterium]|jgi:competence protein ComEC
MHLLIGFAAWVSFLPAANASELRLHFIAVGHGDAILIEQDHSAIALVDAGPPESAVAVLNCLRDLHHDSIEHLFITHTHDDHIGGVPSLLDSLVIGRIHVTGMIERRKPVELLNQRLQSGGWRVDTLGAGDVPIQSSDLRIEVLSPLKAEAANREVDLNGHSMVLSVQHDSVRVLLTADIDRDRENWLVRHYGPRLRSQAMKASHHASSSGNSAEFLQMVDPDIIVISVGSSQWNYPSSETMERLHAFCPTVLRTDSVGTVVLRSDGKTIQVVADRGDDR